MNRRGWFTSAGGELRYVGHIDKRPLIDWAQTSDGCRVIARLTSRRRFSLLGRPRAVQRDLWRELDAATRSAPVAKLIELEVSRYLRGLADLAYAPDLLRVTVSLRRLVLVPRTLVNSTAIQNATTRLGRLAAFRRLSGGSSFRNFFALHLIKEIDKAVFSGKPSPHRPLPVWEEWTMVGTEQELIWYAPATRSPVWAGHFFLYEVPRRGLPRAERKKLAGAMTELNLEAHRLALAERGAVLLRVRHEMSSLTDLTH